jgi:hypothetical protein
MSVPIGGGVGAGQKSPGYKVINKFGVNLDIDTGTTPETIWGEGGTFPFLSVGVLMDVKSDAAADTIAGTGAQKVRITFYDDSNAEFIETFDLNGITPVQINGASTVKIVTRIEVVQAGTGLTNAGKITVILRGGATIYQSILIGEGQTLSTPQIIPAGKKGIIRRISVGYARFGVAFNDADMRFRVRLANGTVLTKFPVVISANLPEKVKDYNVGGVEMEEGDIAYWECTSVSANDTPILAAFDLEIFDA